MIRFLPPARDSGHTVVFIFIFTYFKDGGQRKQIAAIVLYDMIELRLDRPRNLFPAVFSLGTVLLWMGSLVPFLLFDRRFSRL